MIRRRHAAPRPDQHSDVAVRRFSDGSDGQCAIYQSVMLQACYKRQGLTTNATNTTVTVPLSAHHKAQGAHLGYLATTSAGPAFMALIVYARLPTSQAAPHTADQHSVQQSHTRETITHQRVRWEHYNTEIPLLLHSCLLASSPQLCKINADMHAPCVAPAIRIAGAVGKAVWCVLCAHHRAQVMDGWSRLQWQACMHADTTQA